MEDIRVVVANFRDGTSKCAKGGLCYVVQVYPRRVRITARSRSGRWIECLENTGRLTNFRIKTMPPQHPRYAKAVPWRPAEMILEALQAPAPDAGGMGGDLPK